VAFWIESTNPLVIFVEKGTPFPGQCPECEAVVPWVDGWMICWNCGFEADSTEFDEIEWEFQVERKQ
jgi:predicted amidophosphoribosyltransferase